MIRKPFTPIPSSPEGETSGGSLSMPRFGTELPVSSGPAFGRIYPALVPFPSVPAAPQFTGAGFSPSWPAPISTLPAGEAAFSGERHEPLPEIVLPPENPGSVPNYHADAPIAGESPFRIAEYNDEDLTEAFAPIVQAAVRRAVYESDSGKIDAFLEPMLRATVRRALAEYSPASRPFQPPGFIDRTVWRMQALFSSRSFEDVLFEKTHRFQVDEVLLFDAHTLALISFASCDPARHSSAKRVEGSAHRIALQIRDEAGGIRRSFDQADGRNVIAEAGEHVVLVAIVRGRHNELVLADLGFCLHRIEDHFRERFEEAGSALMHALQPFLEDCLLIQAPASAA